MPLAEDIQPKLAEDFEWARHAPEVQQNPQHFGKLVAVHAKRVWGVGREWVALQAQAAALAQVPAEQLVIVLVPRPGLWETPK
jgi:hypothetical protein